MGDLLGNQGKLMEKKKIFWKHKSIWLFYGLLLNQAMLEPILLYHTSKSKTPKSRLVMAVHGVAFLPF